MDTQKSRIGLSPYKGLYVYFLTGLVREEDEIHLGKDFIGNWVEDDSSFLFFSSSADGEISRLLQINKDLDLVDNYYFTYEQWQGGRLDPIRVDRFLIAPPWVDTKFEKGVIHIRLDPGVVFGNGQHPTTRGCLQALVQAVSDRPFYRVLDLGTGTGVLALAAALLCAEKVVAVDINPLCVKTATDNVVLNGLESIIRVIKGSVEVFCHEVADLLVANVHYELICELLDTRVFHDMDRLIFSGLMRSQARKVRIQLEKRHFRILSEWDQEMTWFTILAERIESV